jgi:hypothetical protein
LSNYCSILGLQPDSPENNINYNPIGSPPSFPMAGVCSNGPVYGFGMGSDPYNLFVDSETSTILDIGDILDMNISGGGNGMDMN